MCPQMTRMPPNELKLSDRGWPRKGWNTERSRPPASVRWSAWLGGGCSGGRRSRGDVWLGGLLLVLTPRTKLFDEGTLAQLALVVTVGSKQSVADGKNSQDAVKPRTTKQRDKSDASREEVESWTKAKNRGGKAQEEPAKHYARGVDAPTKCCLGCRCWVHWERSRLTNSSSATEAGEVKAGTRNRLPRQPLFAGARG